VALPADSVFVANVVVPSLNVTVPVGLPEPGGTALTAAVKVTTWPNTEGLTEDARAVLLPAWFTVWLSVLLVLPEKLPSPPYTALIKCVAAPKPDVVRLAWSLAFNKPVPSVAAPSLNVTVPVSVEGTALTVAVKVTDCPNMDGFRDEATVVELLALFTVCDIEADVLVLKLASPL
jgi:hypothetical protein